MPERIENIENLPKPVAKPDRLAFIKIDSDSSRLGIGASNSSSPCFLSLFLSRVL